MAATRISHRVTVLLLQATLAPCLATGEPTDPIFEE